MTGDVVPADLLMLAAPAPVVADWLRPHRPEAAALAAGAAWAWLCP